MNGKVYLKLLPSEVAVVDAASRILSAYVTTNAVTPENEEEMTEKAVGIALKIAEKIDNVVKTEGEMA